jgi:hypothetical protein
MRIYKSCTKFRLVFEVYCKFVQTKKHVCKTNFQLFTRRNCRTTPSMRLHEEEIIDFFSFLIGLFSIFFSQKDEHPAQTMSVRGGDERGGVFYSSSRLKTETAAA